MPKVYSKSRKRLTNREIRKYKCAHCGNKAAFQWSICASPNYAYCLCVDCDIHLNTMLSHYFHLSEKIAEDYAKEMRKLQEELDKTLARSA